MKHLGGAQSRAGIADQRMRHRAETLVATEKCAVAWVALPMKPIGAGLALGRRRADRRGIGHHLGHLCPAECRASIARKATLGISPHIV